MWGWYILLINQLWSSWCFAFIIEIDCLIELPMSLESPFLIVPSIFSNFYFHNIIFFSKIGEFLYRRTVPTLSMFKSNFFLRNNNECCDSRTSDWVANILFRTILNLSNWCDVGCRNHRVAHFVIEWVRIVWRYERGNLKP